MRFLILFLLSSVLFGQAILVDGRFHDWHDIDTLAVDPVGDAGDGIDLISMSATSDTARLFIRLQATDEFSLSKMNTLVLYLDADNDENTGLQIDGIGAELRWVFGERHGAFFNGDDSIGISHGKIGLLTLPTITSNEFEIAINRKGVFPPISSPTDLGTFKFFIRDESLEDGDRFPDGSALLTYDFSNPQTEPWVYRPLGKNSPGDIRVVSQNALHDGIRNQDRAPAHSRILQAIQPDIVGFQEMWKTSNAATVAYLDSIMPLGDGHGWYSTPMEGHVVTASRYPILDNWTLWGRSGSRIMAVLVQVDESNQLLVMNSHWSCCGADKNRQLQADTTIAFLRDAYTEGGQIDLPENTPVVIFGDMNLVGDSQQLTTLLTGDIQNEDQFGSDFPPDWDGTDLTDLYPMHVSERVTFTWQNNGEGYNPGRLDYFVYSDHTIRVKNNYILNTRTMSDTQLQKNGLERSDSKVASDHLALVADFSFDLTGDEQIETDESPSGLIEVIKRLLGIK